MVAQVAQTVRGSPGALGGGEVLPGQLAMLLQQGDTVGRKLLRWTEN